MCRELEYLYLNNKNVFSKSDACVDIGIFIYTLEVSLLIT